SVRAMFRMNEALERIDSAFQFALAGREAEARQMYGDNWPRYDEQLRVEANNITLPGEAELVTRLTDLTRQYRQAGDLFLPLPAPDRPAAYSAADPPGLVALFRQIKQVAGDILRINQQNMEEASRDARATARTSLIGFGVGVGLTALLAALSAWQLLRAVLR